jgi:UDP-N-acetylglucosamine 3-dehydrogenase
MATIRVGIVGMGYMGDRFARILRRTSEARLVGVCDNNPERATSVGVTFGVPHYLATEDLLASEHPQLLIVCTPEDYHLAPCLAALERSIGVLVEKPIAASIEDAQRIRDAAQRYGALLSVGHVLRYDTRFMLAKEAVDAGKVGAVQSLHARRWNSRLAQELHLKGRSSLAQFLGVHDYDIVRWFAGAEPIRVYAESRSRVLASYHVDDTAIALISFANGALACVEEGWILPKGYPSGLQMHLDVLGDQGMVRVAGLDSGLAIFDDEQARWPDTMVYPPGEDGTVTGALERELRHVVSCLETGRTPLVTGEDGLAALRIALAVEESAQRQAPVQL